jgi:N utilization substance protein B
VKEPAKGHGRPKAGAYRDVQEPAQGHGGPSTQRAKRASCEAGVDKDVKVPAPGKHPPRVGRTRGKKHPSTGSRRKARIIAFQTLYRWDLSASTLEELVDFSWLEEGKLSRLSDETLLFARLLIQGTLENLKRVDEAIKEQLENWDFSRLARVDLAILRVGVYCLLFQADIPPTVTIDEAVDISKEYGAEDSYRFVNGVLDGVRKRALGGTTADSPNRQNPPAP